MSSQTTCSSCDEKVIRTKYAQVYGKSCWPWHCFRWLRSKLPGPILSFRATNLKVSRRCHELLPPQIPRIAGKQFQSAYLDSPVVTERRHSPSVLQPPDETLDSLQLSLAQFVDVAQILFPSESEPDRDPSAFVRFVLAGRLEMNNRAVRVSINAKQGALPPPTGQYQLFRDIDSVIGMTRDLPFQRPLALFPLPHFRDTLMKNNHLKYKLPGGFKDVYGVSLHKIPNMALGTAERRHITRVFFPRLYKKGSPAISKETRELVYEKCLRPAALTVNPVDYSRWPATYSAAMTLSRDKKGKFHFGTIDFPPQRIRKFGEEFLKLLGEHDGLEDAFFLHEQRGTKSSSHHSPEDADERQASLEKVLDLFDFQTLNPDEWVVDVGLEIRQEGRILQWLTEGHQRILTYLLPSASEENISAILKSHAQYNCDIAAQLGELGGFRSSPGSRGKANQVSYINVYPTDKSVTYQLHDGVFRRRKPWHLFPAGISQLLKDMKCIGKTFESCARDGTAGLEGNARMEIRVPLHLANDVLVDLPYNVMGAALASFTPQTLWYFKYYRLAALSCIVKRLENDDNAMRLRNESLALGAIVAYQLNAIIYRPAEGRAETVLLEAACQHIIEENGSSRPSLYDRGCYFLSDIVETSGSYHLPKIRPIDSEALLSLYRRDSIEDIKAEFHIPQKRKSTGTSINKPSKKRKMTTRNIGDASDGRRVGDNLNMDTDESGGEETDTGDEETIREPVGTVLLRSLNLDKRSGHTDLVAAILNQFPADVFELVTKPKKGDAWILPGLTPRQLSKIDLFKSFKFDRIFRKAQFKPVEKNVWEGLIFDRYFPPKGQVPREGLQNFPHALYYKSWISFLQADSVDELCAQMIRNRVLKWFCTLWWLPFPDCDRMWSTKQSTNKSGWVVVPPGERQTCPRLAINSAHWNAEGGTC